MKTVPLDKFWNVLTLGSYGNIFMKLRVSKDVSTVIEVEQVERMLKELNEDSSITYNIDINRHLIIGIF